MDRTFHHQRDLKQYNILIKKDIIPNKKIPGLYILLNNKSQDLYDLTVPIIINILKENR